MILRSRSVGRRLAGAGLAALLMLAGALTAGETVPALSPALVPGPDLAPQDIVRIQLEALRHNDAGDRGIAVAFRFASPANKAQTGPLPRFARMIKDGPYRLMLEYVAVEYAPVEVAGARARQLVVLVGAQGAPMSYVFHLSRQSTPGCAEGCWMTDAVSAATLDARPA